MCRNPRKAKLLRLGGRPTECACYGFKVIASERKPAPAAGRNGAPMLPQKRCQRTISQMAQRVLRIIR